jgi:hypothetical protein
MVTAAKATEKATKPEAPRALKWSADTGLCDESKYGQHGDGRKNQRYMIQYHHRTCGWANARQRMDHRNPFHDVTQITIHATTSPKNTWNFLKRHHGVFTRSGQKERRAKTAPS